MEGAPTGPPRDRMTTSPAAASNTTTPAAPAYTGQRAGAGRGGGISRRIAVRARPLSVGAPRSVSGPGAGAVARARSRAVAPVVAAREDTRVGRAAEPPAITVAALASGGAASAMVGESSSEAM